MFYPVKILTSKGKVKRVVPTQSLSQRYWGDFFDESINAKDKALKQKGRKNQKKTEAKINQTMTYEELNFSED